MTDYRQSLTDKLIESLEAGTAPWQKPWDAATASHRPYNPTTSKPYRGTNALWLELLGGADPRWATYKQAEAEAWQVRKGEKGTLIEYVKFHDTKQLTDSNGKPVRNEDGTIKTISVELDRPRSFRAVVFNLAQMDNVPPLPTEARSYEWNPIEKAEQILVKSGVPIHHDQLDRAFYHPGSDTIHLPGKDRFSKPDLYYGTALHELGHASGAAHRLNRDLSGGIGSQLYAKEELRAEIASYFLSDRLGIPHDPGQHAAYVKSWIGALKDDKNEIFKASRDAEKITEYVLRLDRQQALEIARHAPVQDEGHQRAHETTRSDEPIGKIASLQHAPDADPERLQSHVIDHGSAPTLGHVGSENPPRSFPMEPQQEQLTKVREVIAVINKTELADPAMAAHQTDLMKASRGLSTDNYKQLDAAEKVTLSVVRNIVRNEQLRAPMSHGLMTTRQLATRLEILPQDSAQRPAIEADLVKAAKSLGPQDYQQLDPRQKDTIKLARAHEKERGHDQLTTVKALAGQITKLDPGETQKLADLTKAAVNLGYHDYRQLSVAEKSTLAFARSVTKENERLIREPAPEWAVDTPTRDTREPRPTPAVTAAVPDLREKIREIQEFKGMPSEKKLLQKELVSLVKLTPPEVIDSLTKPESKVIAAARNLGISR